MARLIVVSNRVSIPSSGGAPRAGGLEVALAPVLKNIPSVWFGWSGNVVDADQVATQRIEQGRHAYVVTDLSEEDYQEYYNGFANRVLWPVLHYRIDLTEFTRRDLTGYFRVNRHFARELSKILEPDDFVWIHDYHLIPIAEELRQRGHANRIGFFLHVPFPAPEVITVLPNHERLLPSLLQYDLVGFQTETDVGNFVRYLVSEHRGTSQAFEATDHQLVFSSGDRQTRIGSFPVGLDVEEFQRRARRAVQSSFVREVVESLGDKALVIGVDRLDYSKGLVQRMDAFERFYELHAEWRAKVTYLQIAPPSRSEIPEYSELEQAVGGAAGRINGKYGEVAWTPIRYLNRTYSRVGAGRPLSLGARGAGDAAPRRHESRGEGICRRARPRRSGRAHPVPLCRRRRGVPAGAAGQPLRSGIGGGGHRPRAQHAARRAPRAPQRHARDAGAQRQHGLEHPLPRVARRHSTPGAVPLGPARHRRAPHPGQDGSTDG